MLTCLCYKSGYREPFWIRRRFSADCDGDQVLCASLQFCPTRPSKSAKRTGGADYQISVVRYFGDGSEEPYFTMEGSTNIEFDNWGLGLWVLGG
jgi:hypothetical protein